MAKHSSSKPSITSPAAQYAKRPGNKLSAKDLKATAHKAPERRNENKARGK